MSLQHRTPDRQATTVSQAITRLFQPLPSSLQTTLTLDNGRESAEHEQLATEAVFQVQEKARNFWRMAPIIGLMNQRASTLGLKTLRLGINRQEMRASFSAAARPVR
jgi:IS30 family transposase